MRDYRLYLFDFDNTLFDTRYGITVILRNALPMLGVEYNELRFAECLGLSMDQVFDRYCSDRSKYDAYRDEFMKVVNSDAYMGAEPFPETLRVLETLESREGFGSVRTSGTLRTLRDRYPSLRVPQKRRR